MKQTFLHLSDLHFRPHWEEQSELVCNAFFDDLVTEAPRFENLKLIFSGDLVQAGGEQDQYARFKDKFNSALDKLGVPKDSRFCVPGNHDVSRSAIACQMAIEVGALGNIKDETAFKDNLPALSTMFFEKKLENYKAAEAEFATGVCCSPEIAGRGFEIGGNMGIYCLNTSLCSFGGLPDANGKPRTDKGSLGIATRPLHKWLANSPVSTRILVMHHPTDWLTEWATEELETIIANRFHLVLSGHVHKARTAYHIQGERGVVRCVAPPLFTRKGDTLGYAFITISDEPFEVAIKYRQWTQAQKFVTGTALSNNDSGTTIFTDATRYTRVQPSPFTTNKHPNVKELLDSELKEALTCYPTRKHTWVERDLSNKPEACPDKSSIKVISTAELAATKKNTVIRAPQQFGLTCLGRHLSLECFRLRGEEVRKIAAMIDTNALELHRKGIIKAVDDRLEQLGGNRDSLAIIILDNWANDKRGNRVLEELGIEFKEIPLVLLNGVDDCVQVGNALTYSGLSAFETIYLWSLSRNQVRDLVASYTKDIAELDEELVLKKLLADINALNIHRTPMNCLLILKLLEQAFDDSPVNRTEMIGRVLYTLFFEFEEIPRYAIRPDLKDCEYALGYVSEQLIRTGKSTFTKSEFYSMVQNYCANQVLDLDCEILFAFLVSENVLISRGHSFEFRFSYWLFYFAAHRMHHNEDFANFVFEDCRYASAPEIVEFYTGIDRRRTNAVARLASDLAAMNQEFLKRTGIPDAFNPLELARWEPDPPSIDKMQQSLAEGAAETNLPQPVKDAIADRIYDRARPYRQDVAKFVNESSLKQMMQIMRGAARALRNSDYVDPAAKKKLLAEVMTCWFRICQVLAIISPVLADKKSAYFEGISFILDAGFGRASSPTELWREIMCSIPWNVTLLFQDDIFSKKLGPLFSEFIRQSQGTLPELLLLMVVAKQRPPGWEGLVESYIVRTQKNSFYLSRLYLILREELETTFAGEGTREQLRRLAAMAIAKHQIGAKHPNQKLLERAEKALDASIERKPIEPPRASP